MASDTQLDKGDDITKSNWHMLLERVRARTVVPFLGAGLSADLLPLWDPLISDVSKSVLGDEADGIDPKRNDIKTEAIRTKLNASDEPEAKKKKHGRKIIENDYLADQFAKAFREKMKKRGEKEWFDSFVLGSDSQPKECSKFIRTATIGHRAVCTGPWPIILTTNWDTMLEASYRMIDENDEQNSDVWGESHPRSSYFKSRQTGLPVRFRSDIQQVYAELRAGLRPPRLLKLHGDFTDRGVGEMVAGHADYRRLMIRDVGFSRLMQHICSNYHLLFYGCSLTDRDVLAILDGMAESLGSETGPHFWITTKELSEWERVFLEDHYSVRTLLYESHHSARERLKKLCDRGWTLPKRLVCKGLDYKVSSKIGTHATVRIEHGSLEDAIRRMESKSNASFSVGIPVSLGDEKRRDFPVQKTKQLEELVGLDLLTNKQVKAFRYKDTDINAQGKLKEGWRSKLCYDKCWFLCAEDLPSTSSPGTAHGGTSAKLSGVFKAVKHFLIKKSEKPAVESKQEQEQEQEQEREQIFLPLLGGGGGNLNDHEVLRTMLSAIGKFARSKQLCADITVCLGTYRTDAIMADIDAGRFNPAQLLARAAEGKVEFTCIAPTGVVGRQCSLAQADESRQKWKCRKLLMKTNATVNQLRREMGLTPVTTEKGGEKRLLEVGITDGSVKEIGLKGEITDGQ